MNLHAKYELQEVINASGKMTVLGVSKVDVDIKGAVDYGLSNFFVMDDLFKNCQKHVAKLLNAEASCIVSSASAAVAMSIASLITGDNLTKIEKLYTNSSLKRDVVILKGHNVNYGGNIETMINLGHGVVKEVGNANSSTKQHLIEAIDENTLCLMYVKSHHCVQKNQVSIEDFVAVGRQFDIPLIIDAAAEEDLFKYYKMGFDIVIYSGAKAIEGPTSGLVIGRQKYLDNVYLQYKGIGRAMKVGKESILGLTYAVEKYVNLESNVQDQLDRCEKIREGFKTFGLDSKVVQDPAGRDIYRVLIEVTDGYGLIKKLVEGDISVQTRNHQANLGILEFDVRALNDVDIEKLVTKMKQIIKGL